MLIRQIRLQDVKGITELDFRLSRSPEASLAGWNVVTGDNASGKTTLLKAIAMALVGPDLARILQPSLKGWVRDGESGCTIAIEVQPGSRDVFVQGRPYVRPFWAELKCTVGAGGDVHLAASRELNKKGKGPAHGPWAESPNGWFSAGYGPFRRLYGASSEAQRIMSGPSRIARYATMFREDATLGECELWLVDLRHKELEAKPREAKILQQVLKLLNDDFLKEGMTVERVDSEGLWIKDARGVVLPLKEMSEGYRASLALLVDLVRHMEHTFGPDELVVERDGKSVVTHQGVILIDEIDSHLHPEWQRRIGFWLKEHFPECQFFVTTHSPIICQAADNGGVFHLPAITSDRPPFQLSDEEYRKVIKSGSDDILCSEAFELPYVRSDRAIKARRSFSQLRSKEASVGLSPEENVQLRQLGLFVDDDPFSEGVAYAANKEAAAE